MCQSKMEALLFSCGCIGRRDARNFQTGGGVRGGGRRGETPHPSFSISSPPPPVCLELSVIFSAVKDDRSLQTHKGSGRRTTDGMKHGTLNNLSCLDN